MTQLEDMRLSPLWYALVYVEVAPSPFNVFLLCAPLLLHSTNKLNKDGGNSLDFIFFSIRRLLRVVKVNFEHIFELL